MQNNHKLNRFQFFLALGIIPNSAAKAADVFFHGANNDAENSYLGKNKPDNDRCPVCGSMAAKYIRQTYSKVEIDKCKPSAESATGIACPIVEIPFGDASRLIRCARCNNAFFQDASLPELP